MQQVNAQPTQALDLKDIHLPEQISNYPIAYGWWILAALIMFLIVMSVIKIRKAKKINHIKKQALGQLTKNPEMNVSETLSLLKWAAMHYFSRQDLAKLFGPSLQSYLINKLPSQHQNKFTQLSEKAFLNQYQTSENSDKALYLEDFTEAAKLWLTHALPPKKMNVIQRESGKQGVNS